MWFNDRLVVHFKHKIIKSYTITIEFFGEEVGKGTWKCIQKIVLHNMWVDLLNFPLNPVGLSKSYLCNFLHIITLLSKLFETWKCVQYIYESKEIVSYFFCKCLRGVPRGWKGTGDFLKRLSIGNFSSYLYFIRGVTKRMILTNFKYYKQKSVLLNLNDC